MPHPPGMKAKNLADLLVYRKAVDAADEVSALLRRPAFSRDFELKDQLSRSSGRVGPLIAEGFGQITDRQMADYYGRARGSAYESHGHLARAKGKQYISEEELLKTGGKYIEITKMLTHGSTTCSAATGACAACAHRVNLPERPGLATYDFRLTTSTANQRTATSKR
jgi:four helix bundle protein